MDTFPVVDTFLENAQRIFDVARSDESTQPNDFALFVREDGGLHFVMESDLSLDEAAIHREARTAYRVTKTGNGSVRVAGRSGNLECLLEQRSSSSPEQRSGYNLEQRSSSSFERPYSRFRAELLRDQPLYRISSPLTISASS